MQDFVEMNKRTGGVTESVASLTSRLEPDDTRHHRHHHLHIDIGWSHKQSKVQRRATAQDETGGGEDGQGVGRSDRLGGAVDLREASLTSHTCCALSRAEPSNVERGSEGGSTRHVSTRS